MLKRRPPHLRQQQLLPPRRKISHLFRRRQQQCLMGMRRSLPSRHMLSQLQQWSRRMSRWQKLLQ
jgi:hypothetical protein